MDANIYQDQTSVTEVYTVASQDFLLNAPNQLDWLNLAYCTIKLNGEAGEVAEIVGKSFRSNLGDLTDKKRIELAKELGDCAWYIARIADLIGYRLSDIFEMNITKLADRQQRDMIHGDGDNR